MAEIYFKESQKIHLGWKWSFFIALYTLMFWALLEQFAEESDIEATIAISFSLFILVLFNAIVVVMKLETFIDEVKILYQYKPFHKKPRKITWDEVESIYIRHYKPFREYGGHGIHTRMGRGKAFTVSGKNGLQLVLNSGKNILIGTQKPKEMEMAMKKLKKQN